MGMTTIQAKVFNIGEPLRVAEVEFVVDSGAVYSVVPRTVLEGLGITPQSKKKFYLADGRSIEREMAFAGLEYLGERAPAPVIMGEEGDSALMDVTTLEGFGFVFDPIKRELRPMVMRL